MNWLPDNIFINNLMTSPATNILASGDPLHHNYDFPILSLPNGYSLLTNHILMMLIAASIMLIFLPRAARRIATGKTGTSHDYVTKGYFSHILEVICIFFREEVTRPALGKNTDKFMPFIWTVFFFILINNLLGMIPLLDITALLYQPFSGSGNHVAEAASATENAPLDFVDTDTPANEQAKTEDHGATTEVAHDDNPPADLHAATTESNATHASEDEHHVWKLGNLVLFQDMTQKQQASHFHGIGGTATANVAVTGAMALIAIIVIIGSGIKSLGFMGFLHHLTLDAPVFLWPITIFLELIGLVVKPFALTVRLAANMTAGHLMLAALLGFCSMSWNGLAVVSANETSFGGAFASLLISIASIVFAVLIGWLEMLVAFIQAYIFTFLTAMFISLFQHQEHEHNHEHSHAAIEQTIATA